MKIEQLELWTANVEDLAEFYGSVLKLPVSVDDQGLSLTIAAGTTELVFLHKAGFDGQYHFAIDIPEKRVDAARQFVESVGISLLTDDDGEPLFHFESWKAHSIYFYDPSGNIVELIARHDVPSEKSIPPENPFVITELMAVSEVGMAARDVTNLACVLAESCGVHAYKESSPTFMPMGDVQGLLILVEKGRIWFPSTGVAAEELPLRVIFSTESGTFEFSSPNSVLRALP